MIHGLQIDVAAKDLIERIERRVAYHRKQVDLAKAQLASLRTSSGDPEPASNLPPPPTGFGRSSPIDAVTRRAAEHHRRAELLTFLKEHLIGGEIYRLSERDLELADLLPRSVPRW